MVQTLRGNDLHQKKKKVPLNKFKGAINHGCIITNDVIDGGSRIGLANHTRSSTRYIYLSNVFD